MLPRPTFVCPETAEAAAIADRLSNALRTFTARMRMIGHFGVGTLSGDLTLTRSHAQFGAIDPGGASRTITLPTATDGEFIVGRNTADAAGENLVVQNPAAVTLSTIPPGGTAIFACEDTTWFVLFESWSGSIDANGFPLVLDADADTSLTASTDDQIDVTIAGAIDFVLTANTFTASSGSTIATNTIAETTAANGVAIDGLTIKDASVRPTVHADPGNGGAIPVTSSGVCGLTSAGAETRTLAIPVFKGQRLTLYCDTYVGDIVVTVASAINVANNTIMTFGAASEAIELVGVSVGGTLCWQVGWNDGVGLT